MLLEKKRFVFSLKRYLLPIYRNPIIFCFMISIILMTTYYFPSSSDPILQKPDWNHLLSICRNPVVLWVFFQISIVNVFASFASENSVPSESYTFVMGDFIPGYGDTTTYHSPSTATVDTSTIILSPVKRFVS